MRRFQIRVNGKAFDVEVEEVRGAAAPAPAPAARPQTAPAPAPAPVSTPAPAPAPVAKPQVAAAPLCGEVIETPLPGNVLRVLKKAGDAVKAGEAVVIIEAMKMENEIVVPRDGVISGINAQVGTSVQTGEALFSLQ